MNNIEELRHAVYQNAWDKGFYDKITDIMNNPCLSSDDKRFIKQLWVSTRFMLIVSELAEGLEGLRNDNFSITPKSGGVGEEIADAQIRLADLSLDLNIDLVKAVTDKHNYNKNRPFKHGRTGL